MGQEESSSAWNNWNKGEWWARLPGGNHHPWKLWIPPPAQRVPHEEKLGHSDKNIKTWPESTWERKYKVTWKMPTNSSCKRSRPGGQRKRNAEIGVLLVLLNHKKKGSWFEHLWPFCVEVECCPRVCVGSLMCSGFLPQSNDCKTYFVCLPSYGRKSSPYTNIWFLSSRVQSAHIPKSNACAVGTGII